MPKLEELRNTPRGAIIGVMTIADCVEVHQLPKRYRRWASGPYCYIIENAHMFKSPIPWRGSLGFFRVPDTIVARELARARRRQ